MGRFIIKILAVAAVVGLVFLPVNQFVSVSHDYNINHAILNFKNNPRPVDIINVGASHSMYGYNFKSTGLEHLDLALPAQTIEYDYKLLKEYGEHLKSDGVVLVSLSQITFGSTDTKFIGNYYEILDREDIDPYNVFDYYSYLYLPGANTASFLSAVTGKFKEFRWEDHKPWVDNGDAYAERKSKRVEAEYAAAVEANTIPENMRYLKKIFEYCEERDYTVVLTIEPVHESYAAYFSEDDMERLVFQHLDALDLDVPLLDYMNDERFASSREYFIDGDHLNKTGRKVYSEIVYEDLKEMGYLHRPESIPVGRK